MATRVGAKNQVRITGILAYGWDGTNARPLKVDSAGQLSIGGMTISNDGTVTTFLGTAGDYNRVGDAGTTGHSLNSEDDWMVTGELEVKGDSFFDGNMSFGTSGAFINTLNTDNSSIIFRARDNGVGLVEIARLLGGADPYTRIGRDDTGVATNSITTALSIIAGAGTNNEAQGQGASIVFGIGNAASELEKRGSIDCYLETATNGAEDTDLHFWTMAAGALNQAFKVGFNGELYADLDGDSGAYLTNGVNLFDEYDDAMEIRRYQLTVPNTGLITEGERLANRERLRELGIVTKKNNCDGEHLKVQSLLRLFAGGIYQNRQYLDKLAGRVEQIAQAVGV